MSLETTRDRGGSYTAPVTLSDPGGRGWHGEKSGLTDVFEGLAD